ncbi:MAG: hypothetical protein H6813_01695 [Phycisphaeraceae bacterium]|nr:hypothetical protein [Phycisphaeraceae bacterium]
MGSHSASTSRSSASGEQPGVRCLIVAPRGSDGEHLIPDDLLRSLRKHDVAVDRRPGVFDAIAAMITHEKRRKRREAKEGMALVVVDPDRVPRAEELVGASERYAPSVVCWRYDSHTRLKLHAYTIEPPQLAEPAASAPAPSQWGAAPQLRLAGESDLEPEYDANLDDNDASRYGSMVGADATQLLTEDELSMLLGDEPYDGSATFPGEENPFG